MTSSLKPRLRYRLLPVMAAVLLLLPLTASATLPAWLQHVLGASGIESALYRTMHLPAADALYPRPPKEAQTELARLIAATPDDAEIYRLRARTDEQALDEVAAEADWKLYAGHARGKPAAQLELAAFYQRRLMIPQAVSALKEAAAAPTPPSETYLDPTQQRSWLAYDRLLDLASDQALPPAQTASILDAFLTRYPDQPSVYALNLRFALTQQDFRLADGVVARYRRQYPQETIFPTRAEALIAETRGDTSAALQVYDRAFAPLWPSELMQSYFALLHKAHRERGFVADARARLAAHPDGPEALNALARIFYYEQQAGRPDAAQRALDAFRVTREAHNGAWVPLDLYTLASLAESAHSYAEAARYHFALVSVKGTLPDGEEAAQAGLAGLVHTLLEAPDQPLVLGTQNLTLYRDIATLDQGPGYWNGILSLWLNDSGIQSAYNAENDKAQSYFHRAKAAELLDELDKRFPAAPERPALHAELLQAISQYGEPAAVIGNGKHFLADFPNAPQRTEIAGLMADAYAQQNDTAAEFALYDAQLAELAAKSKGMPLTAAATPAGTTPTEAEDANVRVTLQDATGQYTDDTTIDPVPASGFSVSELPLTPPPARRSLPEATAYSRELDRYLGRLTATGNLPRALTVLKTQLDRNPDDPLLYEKLASFLQQNNLSAQQEKTFELAIARFQQPTWYARLSRLYLREKKREAFAELTGKVTDTFSGTDLDAYFRQVNPGKPIGPQMALKLNLYTAKRFPHDLVFTRNLLTLYQSSSTSNSAAFEALLRRVWWQSPDLETQFLTFLSRTNKLDAERNALAGMSPTESDPAAARELAGIDVFKSHYEEATPLLARVATLYPAEADLGDTVVSLFRSQAYLDPTLASTQRAVAVETSLLHAAPDSIERLATLGDLYAEATSTGGEDLSSAAPYWQRMTTLHPGSTQGFLLSATIFWDYFQFDDALTQLNAARTRFHAPSLFAYEAGAIAENRHDLATAVAEYTNAAAHPISNALKQDSVFATLENFFKPPSDAADSNLWATAQSFVGTPEAGGRLLTLARRKDSADLVDRATASAFNAESNNSSALTLRADVLTAQHHAPELNPLLTSLFEQALAHVTTFEQAETAGNLAQSRNLTSVYEHALSRQVDLTPDPVQKIELEYALARSLESHQDLAGATRIVDAVYRANPRVLGVDRTTVDFYARNKQPQKAIATLLEAAQAATPGLARDFTLEAANRANESGNAAQARALATKLLEQTPYDARVLAILSNTYVLAHDDAGLKQFFLARLDAARTDSALSRDERRENIAILRRGLIPALTRAKDYDGAVAQYIALLSAFPEDASTAQEAALYARRHNDEKQLVDFLGTTMQASPKDSRFAALLGQVQTIFGDLPAAEAAWSKAIAIRQDRADFYNARVSIELRLSQSDPSQSELAAVDLARLYLLTYHDPAQMVRLAELRARQQRPEEAVKALRTAYIEGHAETAADNFQVADQLTQWNLLPQAETFARRGVSLAGNDLLTPKQGSAYPQPAAGAVVYARVETRLGKAADALATLESARHAAEVAANSPSVLAAELARQNLAEDEATSFRQNFAQQQSQTAHQQLRLAVNAIGAAVQTYYTPEQKQAYAQVLDHLHVTNASLALQAATTAGLADREAAWRRQTLLSSGNDPAGNLEAFSNLERRRLAFVELAEALEAHAALVKPEESAGILDRAATAFRDGGDTANEMRLERKLVLRTNNNLRDRYFDLLLRHDRDALIAFAGNQDQTLADAAVNFTVAHATQAQALSAIARRGQALPAVWRPASASLAETWFASAKNAPANIDDFTQSLGWNATIADRIGKPANPDAQLTGDTWFYNASRFGIFLATSPQSASLPDAEDFLPAQLEASPADPESYLNLARSYTEAGQTDAALAEYNHALELEPDTSDTAAVEDRIAALLDRAQRRDLALQHWHNGLGQLLRMQQHAIYPEQFFTSFETILDHLGTRRLTTRFTPDIEAILSGYLAKNGDYRSNELLRAVYTSAASPPEGAAFVTQLAGNAPEPLVVLDDLRRASAQQKGWLDEDAVSVILKREIELARHEKQEQTASGSRPAAAYQQELLELYFARNDLAQAEALLNSLSGKQGDTDFMMDRIILATRTGHIAALFGSWRADPDSLPTETDFSSALYRLQKSTKAYRPDPAQIRPLAEFLFERKQQDDKLAAPDYLLLARLRLDTNDLPGALDLLRQLSLIPGNAADTQSDALDTPDGSFNENHADVPFGEVDPYVNADSAATLLEATQHAREAIPFLQSLVQLVPWKATYRLRLGQAQKNAGAREEAVKNLTLVSKDASAPYESRVAAAATLGALEASANTDLGSRDLTLIAHPTTAEAARQPYFTASRAVLAMQPSTSGKDREVLLREAIGIAPDGLDSDRNRLTLLLARSTSADPSVTLAILNSMQTQSASQAAVEDQDKPEETDADATDTSPESDEAVQKPAVQATPLPALASTLGLPSQIQLAVLLSTASQQNDDLASALRYAEAAISLSAEAATPDPQLQRRRDELKLQLALERRNALRRPHLQSALAQSTQVRPRLTASTLATEASE